MSRKLGKGSSWYLMFLEPQYGDVNCETQERYCIHYCSTLGHVDPQARPKELGRHGESVWIDRGPLNIVAVDPVLSIRYHHNGIPASMAPSTETPSKNQNTTSKPSLWKTHFSLTNAHWQVLCGRKMAASRSRKLMKAMDLQPAIDLLAQHCVEPVQNT